VIFAWHFSKFDRFIIKIWQKINNGQIRQIIAKIQKTQ
jgi:hypothetical protein